MDVLRTDPARFAEVRDFPWEPREVSLPDGLRMAYVDAGPPQATETVLLLHGEPTWGYLYRTMIEPLVDAGCRVVVPDLIGFGRSDKPAAPSAYTYRGHVEWVSSFVRALDLHRVTFFGQDWGGLIGGRVVAALEDRFARVVFSNTAMPGSGPGLPGISAQEPLPPSMLRELLGQDWRETVDDDDCIVADEVHRRVEAGGYLYFPAWRVYAQEVAELVPSKVIPGWCLATLPDHVLAAYDAPFPTQAHAVGARRFPLLAPVTADDVERVRNDEAWAVLERWTKPALTIWGDRCPHTALQMGADFRARIPGAQRADVHHTVHRASHYIQEDCGEVVAEEIAALIGATPDL